MAAVDVAATAARQVIAEGLTVDADARLVDHAIQQLPTALATRRAAIARLHGYVAWSASRPAGKCSPL